MKCFECGGNIQSKKDESFIGLDIPYTTLILHDECYRKIKKDLNRYVNNNADKLKDWMIYMDSQKTNKKGKRKYSAFEGNGVEVEVEEDNDVEDDEEEE